MVKQDPEHRNLARIARLGLKNSKWLKYTYLYMDISKHLNIILMLVNSAILVVRLIDLIAFLTETESILRGSFLQTFDDNHGTATIFTIFVIVMTQFLIARKRLPKLLHKLHRLQDKIHRKFMELKNLPYA